MGAGGRGVWVGWKGTGVLAKEAGAMGALIRSFRFRVSSDVEDGHDTLKKTPDWPFRRRCHFSILFFLSFFPSFLVLVD